jgi:type I restriction enzyme S subunit
MSRAATIRLQDACEFIVDCLHHTAPIQEVGFPSIRTPNIGKGRLLLNGVNRVSEETYAIWTQRAVPEEGDLILAREAPAGNVAIIKEGQKVCLGQRTVHLRPNKTVIDPDFLCYFLLAPIQQGKLLAGETGATAKHVNMADIRRLELSNLPDLQIQKKAGALIGAYDDLIENNSRRMALLEDSARQLYREWFVRLRFPGHEHTPIVDGVPQGWERAPLESALVLQRGFDLPTQDRQDGEVPIYGSTGILGHHNQAKAAAPGVVTGRSGTLGEVQYVDEDYWPLNTALWVKEFKRVTPLFALFLLSEMDLKQFNGGASVPTLDRKSVHRVDVLIPSAQMLRAFNEFAVDVFAQVKNLAAQNQKLLQARDLLLPRLMNGELAV